MKNMKNNKSIYKEWEDGGKENSKLYKKYGQLREGDSSKIILIIE